MVKTGREANGRIFVWTGENGTEPTTGSFFVKPFDFLAHLNDAYCSGIADCAGRGDLLSSIRGDRRSSPLRAANRELHNPAATGR